MCSYFDHYQCFDTLLFIRDSIIFLELEFKYWEDNHKVNFVKDGIQYSMFRYNCEEDGPRPESYFEDFAVFTYEHTELYNAIHNHEIEPE